MTAAWTGKRYTSIVMGLKIENRLYKLSELGQFIYFYCDGVEN